MMMEEKEEEEEKVGENGEKRTLSKSRFRRWATKRKNRN